MCVRIRIVGVFGVVLIWNRDLLKTALKKDEPPRVESVKAVESVESVKKENIMEEENDAALLKQQIQCCIEKLMPRLRFESTYRELKKRGERGFVDRVEGDRNTRVLQVLHVTKTDV